MHDGPITQWLAILGAVSLIYWGWRIVTAIAARGEKTNAPAEAVVAPPPPAAPNNDIAVIAAAVAAMIGAHRVVHIEAEGQDRNWAAEGRWMHQTSHRPHA